MRLAKINNQIKTNTTSLSQTLLSEVFIRRCKYYIDSTKLFLKRLLDIVVISAYTDAIAWYSYRFFKHLDAKERLSQVGCTASISYYKTRLYTELV